MLTLNLALLPLPTSKADLQYKLALVMHLYLHLANVTLPPLLSLHTLALT